MNELPKGPLGEADKHGAGRRGKRVPDADQRRIVSLVRSKWLTQAEAARAVNVTRTTMSRWIGGSRRTGEV